MLVVVVVTNNLTHVTCFFITYYGLIVTILEPETVNLQPRVKVSLVTLKLPRSWYGGGQRLSRRTGCYCRLTGGTDPEIVIIGTRAGQASLLPSLYNNPNGTAAAKKIYCKSWLVFMLLYHFLSLSLYRFRLKQSNALKSTTDTFL